MDFEKSHQISYLQRIVQKSGFAGAWTIDYRSTPSLVHFWVSTRSICIMKQPRRKHFNANERITAFDSLGTTTWLSVYPVKMVAISPIEKFDMDVMITGAISFSLCDTVTSEIQFHPIRIARVRNAVHEIRQSRSAWNENKMSTGGYALVPSDHGGSNRLLVWILSRLGCRSGTPTSHLPNPKTRLPCARDPTSHHWVRTERICFCISQHHLRLYESPMHTKYLIGQLFVPRVT